ncbi:MAG: 30S ribosomal protein S6 [Calditrichaeota bacterium]|nr:30S ribosomal protein S6 [Calditrichota bacterium]
MAIYETIFILDSLMPPKEIDATIERFGNIIASNGGKVRKVDKWGKRRLAYEIHKKQYGFYGSIEFEGTGNIPKELESEYNFNDKVLRYLTYRYEKRKLKAMAMDEEGKSIKQEPAPVVEPPKKAPVETPEPKAAPAAEEVKQEPEEKQNEAPQPEEPKNEEKN